VAKGWYPFLLAFEEDRECDCSSPLFSPQLSQWALSHESEWSTALLSPPPPTRSSDVPFDTCVPLLPPWDGDMPSQAPGRPASATDAAAACSSLESLGKRLSMYVADHQHRTAVRLASGAMTSSRAIARSAPSPKPLPRVRITDEDTPYATFFTRYSIAAVPAVITGEVFADAVGDVSALTPLRDSIAADANITEAPWRANPAGLSVATLDALSLCGEIGCHLSGMLDDVIESSLSVTSRMPHHHHQWRPSGVSAQPEDEAIHQLDGWDRHSDLGWRDALSRDKPAHNDTHLCLPRTGCVASTPVERRAMLEQAVSSVASVVQAPAPVWNDLLPRLVQATTSSPSRKGRPPSKAAVAAASALHRAWPILLSSHSAPLHASPFGLHRLVMPLYRAVVVRVYDRKDRALLYPDLTGRFPADANPFLTTAPAIPGVAPDDDVIGSPVRRLARRYPAMPLAPCWQGLVWPGQYLFVPSGSIVAWHAADDPAGSVADDAGNDSGHALVLEWAFLDPAAVPSLRAVAPLSALTSHVHRGLLDALNLPTLDTTTERHPPSKVSLSVAHTWPKPPPPKRNTTTLKSRAWQDQKRWNHRIAQLLAPSPEGVHALAVSRREVVVAMHVPTAPSDTGNFVPITSEFILVWGKAGASRLMDRPTGPAHTSGKAGTSSNKRPAVAMSAVERRLAAKRRRQQQQQAADSTEQEANDDDEAEAVVEVSAAEDASDPTALVHGVASPLFAASPEEYALLASAPDVLLALKALRGAQAVLQHDLDPGAVDRHSQVAQDGLETLADVGLELQRVSSGHADARALAQSLTDTVIDGALRVVLPRSLTSGAGDTALPQLSAINDPSRVVVASESCAEALAAIKNDSRRIATLPHRPPPRQLMSHGSMSAPVCIVVPFLKPSSFYSFRVASIVSNAPASHFSPPSDTVRTNDLTRPGPMKPPVLESATPWTVTLELEPPSDDGGMPVMGYLLFRTEGSHAGVMGHEALVPPGRQVVVKGLRPHSTYSFSVAAVSAMGYGPVSTPGEAVTTPAATRDVTEHTVVTVRGAGAEGESDSVEAKGVASYEAVSTAALDRALDDFGVAFKRLGGHGRALFAAHVVMSQLRQEVSGWCSELVCGAIVWLAGISVG
jgi:hypothetical protein